VNISKNLVDSTRFAIYCYKGTVNWQVQRKKIVHVIKTQNQFSVLALIKTITL
jgi:hypothetical protein